MTEYQWTDVELAEAERDWVEKHNKIMKNPYLRDLIRYRPEGQCFQCGKEKKELKEDPDYPSKIHLEMYIYCDECYAELQEQYKKKGRWTY